MKKISYRHGDWSLIPFSGKLSGEKTNSGKDFTFGEGEATNHFHTAHVKEKEDMEFYRQPDGSWLVQFKSPATLTHPEHSEKVDLVIPVGIYKLKQRREKDWFSLSVRRVVD